MGDREILAEPILAVHGVTHMNRGRLATMMMNFYRLIASTTIQVDRLTLRDGKTDDDDEIQKWGGKTYHQPPLNP